MAVRRRTSSRPTLVGALVALALMVGSCSGDDSQGEPGAAPTTSRPASSADPRLGEIADEIGCSETEPSDRGRRFTGALMCAVDGETTTRIHTFEGPDRTSVRRRFSETFGDSRRGGVECDGNSYQFLVLGDDWLVATNDRSVAGNLVVNLRAELVVPDGEPSRPSEVADVCR